MLQGSLATVQIDIWRGSMLQGSLATMLQGSQIDICTGDQCCRVVLLLYK